MTQEEYKELSARLWRAKEIQNDIADLNKAIKDASTISVFYNNLSSLFEHYSIESLTEDFRKKLIDTLKGHIKLLEKEFEEL